MAKAAAKSKLATKAHEEDMRRLGEQLVAAAKRHGLCDTFQTEVVAISEGLIVPLPVREMFPTSLEFTVVVTGDFTLIRDSYNDRSLAQGCTEQIVNEMQAALNELVGGDEITGGGTILSITPSYRRVHAWGIDNAPKAEGV